MEYPGKPFPGIVHAPFRPETQPGGSCQNTDPLVFGDTFVYRNCMQRARPVLRTLSAGSIVLFGRHSRASGQPGLRFSLDTCLVIGHSKTLTPAPGKAWGIDLFNDAVLAPLASEHIRDRLTVYFGRTPATGGTFSFFPARLMTGSLPLFARPDLCPTGRLASVINPALRQGIKVTSGLTATERDVIWEEVIAQVTRRQCLLGYQAATPPVLSCDSAMQIARGPTQPMTPA